MEVIDKATEEQYERTRDVNEKKIQLKCADVQRRAEVCNIIIASVCGCVCVLLVSVCVLLLCVCAHVFVYVM